VSTDAVRVNAADCNLALSWDRMFDGPPFSAAPDWLEAAVRAGDVWPHTRGGTDYAQWEVKTPAGMANARPGDWIVRGPDGALSVKLA